MQKIYEKCIRIYIQRRELKDRWNDNPRGKEGMQNNYARFGFYLYYSIVIYVLQMLEETDSPSL